MKIHTSSNHFRKTTSDLVPFLTDGDMKQKETKSPLQTAERIQTSICAYKQSAWIRNSKTKNGND